HGPSLRSRCRDRDEPPRIAREQIDAREPGPLAVGREQLGSLPPVDPSAAHRAEELDEPEIPYQPSLEAPEALQADDADRPGPEPSLALEPLGDGVGRLLFQPLQLERAAEASEGRAAAGMQAEPPQLRGRERSEVGGRGR